MEKYLMELTDEGNCLDDNFDIGHFAGELRAMEKMKEYFEDEARKIEIHLVYLKGLLHEATNSKRSEP